MNSRIAQLESTLREIGRQYTHGDPELASATVIRLVNEALEPQTATAESETRRLLFYVVNHSNARTLLSDDFMEDAHHALGMTPLPSTSDRAVKP